MLKGTKTHCCYETALTSRDTYRISHDGWYYSDRFRFSVRSATILLDAPADADRVARAVVAYERAAGLDRCPIDDLTLLRIVDHGQAVITIDRHDVLLRIA